MSAGRVPRDTLFPKNNKSVALFVNSMQEEPSLGRSVTVSKVPRLSPCKEDADDTA